MFDTWISLTVRAPLIAIPIILLILAALIYIVIRRLRTRRQENQIQLQELQHLRDEIEAQRQTGPESARMDIYRQFIYNISHEVANPLQSIQTNLDNMARCTPEEIGRWQQYQGVISAEIKRLSVMTQNLRLLSRLETEDIPVKREPINIKAVIEDVMMAQIERAEQREISLIYKGPNRPARVFGNRDHLRQVLINLVDNSIKYSQDGGSEIIIRVQDDGPRLIVQVSDDGIGIPEEDHAYIFDTAYRVPSEKSMRRAGTGLGLAIVKRIIEQHGGEIKVESSLGEGATFTFDLPLYSP